MGADTDTRDHGREDDHEEPYLGPWWRFGPLRRALLAGVALGIIFTLDTTEALGGTTASVLYALTALMAASHWAAKRSSRCGGVGSTSTF
ncbi:MAG: hypothetical protein ACR2ME_06710 [Acidimicrobiia bacterium]